MAKSSTLPKTLELLPGEIVLDSRFNSRQEYVERSDATEPGQQLSLSQLGESISQYGVLHPPRVRLLDDGRWACVYGFRRIKAAHRTAPERPILCTIQPQTGSTKDDDLAVAMENLAENLHREALQPWEIADALFRIKQMRPDIQIKQLASMTGLSRQYVGNLILLRRKAHPTIWALFKRWGLSLRIPYRDVLQIVSLPLEEQLTEWHRRIELRRSRVGKRGREKRPGPHKLGKMLSQIGALERSDEWKRGCQHALRVALGQETWAGK